MGRQRLTPGGKLSDGDRFTVSVSGQKEKGAEVVRSIAAVQKPHLSPGELSGAMDQRDNQQADTDAANTKRHAVGLANIQRLHDSEKK